MEMEDLLISTGVDSLIRLIKDKQKIDLSMASKLLNLPQTTIEDWAHILEEEGIIKIDYQLTKVYFMWVLPTTEQVEKEKQVFRKRKTKVESEINKLDEIQENGKRELREYTDAISKISEKFERDFAKIDELSKQIEAAKEKKTGVSKQSMEKIDSLGTKLIEIEGSIKGLELQLEKTGKSFEKKDISKKLTSVEDTKTHMQDLSSHLNELVNRVDELKKTAPKEDIEIGNVKEEFETLSDEFQRMHDESEYLRSMISEFKANASTIQDAVAHIKELSTNAEKTHRKLQQEYDLIEALKTELPELEKQIVEDLAVADQYSETISIAQEVLENVPTKTEILGKLTALEEEEGRIAKDFKKIESSLAGVPGNVLSIGELLEELEEMKLEIEESRDRLTEDADEILSSIEEETATYATFQKIKAKTKMAIDAYLAQLAKIRQETSQLKQDLKSARDESKKKIGELAGQTSPETTKNVMALISQLKTKKGELQKIRTLIADLNARSRMIEKNIKLLSKEAKLIALRGEGAGAPAKKGKGKDKGKKEGEVKSKVSLTSEEQEEFERKRKELKGLIRKLWETD